MTTPQGMLELADELLSISEVEQSFGPPFVRDVMRRAAIILRQAAAPQGRQEAREKEITRLATVEECARIADSFTCGGCGMDGKAGAAIRALAQAQEPPNEQE